MNKVLNAERQHFDKIAEAWSPEGVVVDDRAIPRKMLYFRTVIEKSFRPLEQLEGLQVLDCGCGHGFLSVYLAKHGACVTAFDLSPKSVDACRRLADSNGLGDKVSAHVAEFEQLPFADNSFDLVVGTRVLHHVNIHSAGRELRRVLKPNAKAFFWENSDRNPMIRFLHRHARRLGIRKLGTPNERILSAHDINVLDEIFSGKCVVHFTPFVFFTLMNKHIFHGKLPNFLFDFPDAVISKGIPPLRKYSMNQIIELTN